MIFRYYLFLTAILMLTSSCDRIYKAGNLEILSYPVDTPLRTKIVQMYVDTLIAKHGQNVPYKWIEKDKLVNLDSIYFKRIYFKDHPEEMYLISYGGMLIIADVYNPAIRDRSWVTDRNLMPKEEEARIKKRFQEEVLDRIEAMAKADGLSDTTIYK